MVWLNGKEYDETPDGKPFAFEDLPASAFPFLLRYLREDGYELGKGPMVGWCVVDGPMVMAVEGFGDRFPVTVEISYASGERILITSEQKTYSGELTEEMVKSIETIAQAVAAGTITNGQMPPVES